MWTNKITVFFEWWESLVQSTASYVCSVLTVASVQSVVRLLLVGIEKSSWEHKF